MNEQKSEKRSYFNIPKLDFSNLGKPKAEDEIDVIIKQIEEESKSVDWRKFVEDIEQHPSALSSWDCDIPFEEFARRVKAGEYD